MNMLALRRHGPRIAITLVAVLMALLHASNVLPLPFIARLDNFLYDVRMRATMPQTPDGRIVIVDIDDPSLQAKGQWPWARDRLAQLTTEIMERQQAAVLGYDVLFTEPDRGPGADAAFAKALEGKRVALGYFLTQTPAARASGALPPPLLPPAAFPPGREYLTHWNGFGASIGSLASAAPAAGFLNALTEPESDGVLRAAPLLAYYDGPSAPHGYYGSLGLAVYRLATQAELLVPVLAPKSLFSPSGAPELEGLLFGGVSGVADGQRLRVPVDSRAGMLVPYLGPGGARGGTFRYFSAADVLDGKLAPGTLRGAIVLIGTSAHGLQDVRTTPVSANYPGVEVHANVVASLLDRRFLAVPQDAPGYDFVQLLVAGLLLAFGLSMMSAPRALLLALGTAAALIGLNTWLYLGAGLVYPLAGALVMTALAFVLNMSWGYFVEARTRRGLVRLFGNYVPPQLVKEMQADPRRYSMQAQSKVLTVMFCDMRGFTELSERMTPAELQSFLHTVFTRLTAIISAHRGTVDKYMGNCVMAFWGAPVDMPDHATLAVRAAIEMSEAVRELNRANRGSGRPPIGVGIGLNTGVMSVGDMGSDLRRSYTVVGDAVNLASRLEGLSAHYDVDIVASSETQQSVPAFIWQELDRVRVKGRVQTVTIFTPIGVLGAVADGQQDEQVAWLQVLAAYRAQDWDACEAALEALRRRDAKKVLYRLYAQRLASLKLMPKTPNWDGATRFDTK